MTAAAAVILMPLGDHVAGTVKTENAGKVRARFILGLSSLTETQSSGGGRLSYRLVLTVERLSTRRRPRLIHSGPLRQMPPVRRGVFRPEETRTYCCVVLFPEGVAGMDDRLQRASTSLQST